jgi:hypothetical protein
MKKSEDSTPKEALDDSIKLAIREEVESAVEKRAAYHEKMLEQREKYYTVIISIVGTFFSAI